ncbi:cytochrome b [Aurantiacibacter sp. D1-12]|uniref:cytochrome b n=1 Tax=Aurantiacibacter sp. D1-12 TaxID=2993658 RepID=UPI00237CC042|nr:cytochrome b/b6 domain-containing protein [Aurantiacibacter sp. D1-12]MDE1467932.1 cytochrome b/b6 domain-containing protein [Aurantiacibacter sp. D1-12]
MPSKSTATHYGNAAVTIHWLTAILIIALIGSGFNAGDAENAAAKAAFLRVHIPLGVTVLVLTVVRILWWFFADKKPDPLPMPVWQDRMARAVHLLFYIVILGMAASGVGMMVLSGAGPIIFGGSESALPDFWDFKPRFPHGIGGRLILALFVFHAGAALYHQFVKRDGLLGRMWFPRSKD